MINIVVVVIVFLIGMIIVTIALTCTHFCMLLFISFSSSSSSACSMHDYPSVMNLTSCHSFQPYHCYELHFSYFHILSFTLPFLSITFAHRTASFPYLHTICLPLSRYRPWGIMSHSTWLLLFTLAYSNLHNLIYKPSSSTLFCG